MLHDELFIENTRAIYGAYIYVYYPNHPKSTKEGFIRKHILIAENKLNRYLKDGECVHHLDFNKYNNNPDNLIIFKTNADHTRFHKNGEFLEIEPNIYISPITKKKICPICKKEFIYGQKRNIYCSVDCSKIAQRRTERPNKKYLDYLIHNYSFVEIGRMYNVTDNSVRKWCKLYNLPFRKKDIKNIVI